MKVVLIELHSVDGRPEPQEIADTGQVAAYGEPLDVADEVAGRPPKGDPSAEGYDPGEGLLAQVSKWAKADSKAAKDAATEARRLARNDAEGDGA